MSNGDTKPIHWSFWVIGVVALLWNATGAINFFMQFSGGNTDAMPQWWRDVVENRPIWATLAMAVAVFAAILASVLLLLRKAIAYPLFIAALLGVIVTMSHALSVGMPGPAHFILAVIMPIALSGVMIWYAKLAIGKGWIT